MTASAPTPAVTDSVPARLMAAVLAHPRWSALGLGAIAATGFPPLSLWPVTLLAVAGLIGLLLRAPSAKRAAMLGWLFGVAHFTIANNWIAGAFRYQQEMPVALGWLAVPLLALYLAVYPALATFGAHLIIRRANLHTTPSVYTLTFAGCWIIAEWLRSWVFTGFAWDPLGLVLLGPWDRPGIAAVLPWVGTYALSGLVIILAGGLFTLLVEKRWRVCALITGLIVVGMYLPGPARQDGTVRMTLVQPNLQQPELGDPTRYEEQFRRIAALSLPRVERGVASGPRLVLWPESSVPDYLEEGYPQRYYDRMTVAGDPNFARWRIGRLAGEGGIVLVGATNLNLENGAAVSATNTVTAIAEGGRIVGSYDKAHLVPYGEYLALRWLLEPLGATRLVAGNLDYIPGPGPRTLELGALGKMGVQICYEIVFSGQVADPANRPDYIFNPSNEGWFGSWAQPQFLAQSRMRAIEEGLPVLRSTTTGISVVIDANGRVRASIGKAQADRIDMFVPPAKAPTLFARLGNILPLGWAILLIVAALAASLVATRGRSR